jgi:hypothetical protein
LALVEIFARRFRDGGRRGEIDDCFRALLWGNCKELGEPCEARDRAAALIADAGRDEAGMQAIGGDPRAMQASVATARLSPHAPNPCGHDSKPNDESGDHDASSAPHFTRNAARMDAMKPLTLR